ncbi:serine protease HTRA1-like [Oppia nitens]|uniref:serine protease HTRA1-like n=1 Tax=Oppia nitens TaxID=1686743 RepID=UPI0023DB5D12|nr:serine protease HTRA1-like [Oppia nitens]
MFFLYRITGLVTTTTTSLIIAGNYMNRKQQTALTINNNCRTTDTTVRQHLTGQLPMRTVRLDNDQNEKNWIKSVHKQAMPSVVTINRYDDTGIAATGRHYQAGTGFIVDDSIGDRRLVCTSYHVVTDAIRVVVIFSAAAGLTAGKLLQQPGPLASRPVRSVCGRVVYVESHRDLALVQLDTVRPGVLAAATVATSAADVGEPVLMIGSGGDLKFSACSGVIAAQSVAGLLSRDCHHFYNTLWPQTYHYLCHSANSMPGYSGAPIFTASGQVVAVCCSAIEDRIAIAIKLDDLKEFIINGKQYMDNPSLDLRQKRLDKYTTRLKRSLGIILHETIDGEFVVSEVTASSPTIRSKLQVNDSIIQVNGDKLVSTDQLIRQLSQLIDNQSISLRIRSDTNEEMDVEIVPLVSQWFYI